MNRSSLHLDVRDIPSCAKRGFSIRKMWIALKGLLLSWCIWDFAVYLGGYAAGYSLSDIWSNGRLLPVPQDFFWTETLSIVLFVSAFLFIAFIMMKASLKISKITFEELRGDDFYSGREAAEFAKQYSAPLRTVPVLLFFVILFGGAIGLLTGVIFRIPVAGGVITALSILPLWIFNLIIVLTFFALFASVKLLPAIVGTTSGDTYEAVFEVYSVLTSQTWRLFVYDIAAFITIAVSALVFFVFSTLALSIIFHAVSFGAGGTELISAAVSGPTLIAVGVFPASFNLPVIGAVTVGTPVLTGVSGWIAASSGMMILLVLFSYIFSASSASYTLIYLCLRHRKNGENLLERADSFEKSEFERESRNEADNPVKD